jgi:hypothetical protein
MYMVGIMNEAEAERTADGEDAAPPTVTSGKASE